MKRLLILLSAVALTGAGCLGFGGAEPVEAPFEGTAFESREYGFAFDYPSHMEARVRAEVTRRREYLGREMDHFLSLRDTVRGERPENLAFFYASHGLTVDEFLEALEGSPGVTEILGTEEVMVNGIGMTKVTNATEFGTNKHHYLFETDATTVLVSVFVGEDESFDPVLGTFRPHE